MKPRQIPARPPTAHELSARATVRIRRAGPGDARPAAELIYLPMGRMADYLFGFDSSRRAREVLAGLFAQKGSRFSHQFSDVLTVNGRIAGLLLGYSAASLKAMELPMAKQLHALFGLAGMWRFLRRALPLVRYKEAEAGEFYIFTLAIKREFQDAGLGSRLLDHAETKARKLGLDKCSLGVAMDNTGAIHFYKENGFHIIETVRVPPLERAIGYPGYHRMVKSLDASRGRGRDFAPTVRRAAARRPRSTTKTRSTRSESNSSSY